MQNESDTKKDDKFAPIYELFFRTDLKNRLLTQLKMD